MAYWTVSKKTETKLTWNCVITWTNISDKEIDVRCFIFTSTSNDFNEFLFHLKKLIILLYQKFIWKTCVIEMKNPLDLYISLILNWNNMNFNDSLHKKKLRSCWSVLVFGAGHSLCTIENSTMKLVFACRCILFDDWTTPTQKVLVVLCAQNKFPKAKSYCQCVRCAKRPYLVHTNPAVYMRAYQFHQMLMYNENAFNLIPSACTP